MKVTVFNHITLDGVTQAPADPEEDTRDGFRYGGWAVPYGDEVLGRYIGEHMQRSEGALLLGRRTYEHLYGYWPHQTDNPFTDVLNKTQKYVASRTLSEPLPWENSTLLPLDAADAVATMKERGGPDMTVLGSGDLVQSLVRRHLVDELLLTIHPIVLGSGHTLFGDGWTNQPLQLVESTPTTTGVLINVYRPMVDA
jgi:dihydrofolate reductase